MEKIISHLIGESISSNTTEAFSLAEKSAFGEKVKEKVIYFPSEVMFLVEKDKLEVLSNNKPLTKDTLLKKFQKADKKFHIKFQVYKDLREKGYVVKTALKFGADFRVYEKGFKPGEEHAKWLAFCDHESKTLTWNEFSAKSRVAHSTKKNLLLAIVDEEGDVTYYEVNWVRP